MTKIEYLIKIKIVTKFASVHYQNFNFCLM